MKTAVVLAFVLGVCLAQPVPEEESNTFATVSKLLGKCGSDPDVYSCLKLKAVRLLDRATTMESLPIADFASLDKGPDAKEVEPLQDQDLEATLPRDLTEKSSTLDKLLMDRVQRFFDSRTLNFNMPTEVVEGRQKGGIKLKKIGKKGGGVYLALFGAWALWLIKLFMAKIALIAGKALIVGKVALLIAGITAAKGFMSHGHEEKQQVIYADSEHHGHGGGGWSRSTLVPDALGAQELVYRGHRDSRSAKTVTK